MLLTPSRALLLALALLAAACGDIRTDPVGGADASVSDLDGAILPGPSNGDGGPLVGPDGAVLPRDAAAADDGAAHVGDGGSDASSSCAPKCGGKACGPDGCGGQCGSCAGTNATCDLTGKCQCTPYCGGRVCGDDGCGGTCGTCPSLYTCVVNGSCQKDPGSQCGTPVCGSAASCCHCNGQPLCYALPPGSTCESLGAGCN
jgi:hypothetical protein